MVIAHAIGLSVLVDMAAASTSLFLVHLIELVGVALRLIPVSLNGFNGFFEENR